MKTRAQRGVDVETAIDSWERLLIEELEDDVWCRAAPSRVCKGVGLIAVKDIPANVNPVRMLNGLTQMSRRVKVQAEKVYGNKAIPESVKAMVRDFYYEDKAGYIHMPKLGMNHLFLIYFINHDNKNPNVVIERGIPITLRKIKCGEELLADYSKCWHHDFEEGEHHAWGNSFHKVYGDNNSRVRKNRKVSRPKNKARSQGGRRTSR